MQSKGKYYSLHLLHERKSCLNRFCLISIILMVRCYATATIPMAKQLSLEQKLKNLSEFSRKANYVSTINAKDLLDTLIAENASALQYYHCFKFFGNINRSTLGVFYN